MHSLVLIHISAAVISLLSGYMAMFMRKGSRWHGAAGAVFFVSMLAMTSSAAYLALFVSPNRINVVVSFLTFYLVVTAWCAARNRDGRSGIFDAGGLLWVATVSITAIASGFEAAGRPRGMMGGVPFFLYFMFGAIAILCAVSDFRMIKRGGVAGNQRIVRHLSRMGGALLITTLSFFPGQARQLPDWLRSSKLLFLPHIFLVASLIYWRRRYKRKASGAGASGPRIPEILAQPESIAERVARA